MREIKFRVWDKTENRYCNPEFNKGTLSDIFSIDFFVFEQYTGLKDKYSKEIYEGDIVEVWSENVFLFEKIVEWDTHSCYPIYFSDMPDEMATMGWAQEQYEYEYKVIGNIHQNPELLEA